MRTYMNSKEIGGKNLSKGLGLIKIPLTILTYNRPEYLFNTLESFVRLNYDCLDTFYPILLNQGDPYPTRTIYEAFEDFIKVYIESENKGCSAGYNNLMERCLDFPYIMHLQDDWLSTEPITHYLDQILWMFESNEWVGYVRLRSVHSKVSRINRITREEIKYTRWPKRYTWSRLLVGNAHFSLNPSIARSWVIKNMLPLGEELDGMHKYNEFCLQTAQLKANCFNHIGQERAFAPGKSRREEWMK